MSFALRNGVVLPAVGLGTYKANGESLSKAVQWALDCGIQHIDTALGYRVRFCRISSATKRRLELRSDF